MSIRCKFKVDSIERQTGSAPKRDESGDPVKDERGHYIYVPSVMATVKMSPVYANNDPQHENSKFWSATPSGQLQFGCVNEAAVSQLELGAEYYIDISPAPKS